MALTKPRAYQIYDIDYKQATRVITVANVTLSGGAPNQVDGVNLSLDDRVLVNGQTNKAQNGIYEVTTVGSGANGTWVRSGDTNSTGELLAGTIVMVTEGLVYADTQWKLVTNDPITIGVSELVFEQNSAFAFGNVNANGTSNVNVVSSGGNVTVGVAGTGNIAVFSATGANITGTLEVSGNILGGNLSGTSIAGTLTTAAQTNITSVGTLSSLTVTANVAGGNLTTAGQVVATGNVSSGNIITAGQVTAVGNITGGNILGNGAGLTGINAFGTIAVSGQDNVVADTTSDTLTLTAGSGIAITTVAGTDTITIASVATDSIFATGGEMGTITEAVTVSEDLGLITGTVTISYDLGTIVTSGIIAPDALFLPSKTVTELDSLSASPAGQFVYCSNESGGAVPAFSDGTNWRRVTDRAIVS